MPGYRRLKRRAVIVNTKTGKAFKGILWTKTGPLLVIRQAEMLDAGARATPMDGEVLVERANVDFLQLPEVVA